MILLAPLRTEKAIKKIEEENSITFIVAVDATKDSIGKEVETLFGVKVSSVQTFITSKGKKHAVVRLTKDFKAEDVAEKLKIAA